MPDQTELIYQRLPNLRIFKRYDIWEVIRWHPEAFTDKDIYQLTPIKHHYSEGWHLWPNMGWTCPVLWFSTTHDDDGEPEYIATLVLAQGSEWVRRKLRPEAEVIQRMHFRWKNDPADRLIWIHRGEFGQEYDRVCRLLREDLASQLHWDYDRAVSGWTSWNG